MNTKRVVIVSAVIVLLFLTISYKSKAKAAASPFGKKDDEPKPNNNSNEPLPPTVMPQNPSGVLPNKISITPSRIDNPNLDSGTRSDIVIKPQIEPNPPLIRESLPSGVLSAYKGENVILYVFAQSHKELPMEFIWKINGVQQQTGVINVLSENTDNSAIYRSSFSFVPNENDVITCEVNNSYGTSEAGSIKVELKKTKPAIDLVINRYGEASNGAEAIVEQFWSMSLTNSFGTFAFSNQQEIKTTVANQGSIITLLADKIRATRIGSFYNVLPVNPQSANAPYTIKFVAKEAKTEYDITAQNTSSWIQSTVPDKNKVAAIFTNKINALDVIPSGLSGADGRMYRN